MSSRGKRILAMLSHKDTIRLGQLELKQPTCHTTQGVNLREIDVNVLKKKILGPLSPKSVKLTETVNFQMDVNSENNRNKENTSSIDILCSKSITENIKVLSNFTIKPTDLQYTEIPLNVQEGDNRFEVFESADKEITMVEPSLIEIHSNEQTNDKSEEITFTQLTNVFPTADAELNFFGQEHSPFSDSGTEYVPSTPSCASDLGLSSDSNESVELPLSLHSKVDISKSMPDKRTQLNEIEEDGTNANSQKQHEQSGRNNENLTQFNQFGVVKTSSRNIKGTLKRDKKEHCIFCEKNITNFSRHLIRKHETEIEVIKIMSLPKSSKQRKCLFDDIRKRGNFINSFGNEGFINPVRRPKSVCPKTSSDYLPCSGCKGFFTRTYLHRHMKKCFKKTQETESKHAQANGLTLLYMSSKNNFEDLKLKVFPHMAADEITKSVMNDFLIKLYGQRYYRCHKEKHLINTVSQRMRELARFLKVLQNKEPNERQLIDYLKPSYFDQLVDATNELSGYDPDKDTYRSPSLALRWATVLKQICDTAMFVAAKENNMVKNKEIKILRQMIETQFRFHVSTNANKDLSAKSWKKGSMIPLTEDVIKMNKFVIREEEKWSTKLLNDPNSSLYVRNLTEALLAHVILLNRKRSGEAQRIKIEDYLREEDESAIEDIYQSLTATELVLIRNIKRITIRGKKGRAVPVIFTKDMQRYTDILLKSRKLVASSNPYLFANPSTNNSFLWSYKVLKKVADDCAVINIESITATCLRKHIATIAQIISMEDSDLEQLSTHLGHEKATHLNYYRKTDDKLQIAKVSKLLLLMEKKSMGEYRGKSLANIDFEIPDVDDDGSEDDLPTNKTSHDNEKIVISPRNDRKEECNEEDNLRLAENKHTLRTIKEQTQSPNLNDENQKKKCRVLIPWTSEQKKFALIYFQKHLASKKAPRKHECLDLMKKHSTTFYNKTWTQIKIFIVNKYSKK